MSHLQENRRNIGVDVLRGISILLVILLHINIHFGLKNSYLGTELPSKLFSFLFWNGFYGVVIFFTLSGYLITTSILRRSQSLSEINLKQFYWFRFSRIMPLLIALLVVLSVLHLTGVSGYVINLNKTSLLRAIFSVLTFHFNWLEIQVGYLPANWDVLWSISIEECFYLVFPIVCLALKKDWQFVFILLLFVGISPWARVELFLDNDLAYKNHLGSIDAIAFGCMTAIIAHKFNISKKMNALLLIIGSILIVMVMFYKGMIWRSGLTELGLNVSILSIGVSMVVLWMHNRYKKDLQKDYLAFRWLKQMGKYSYEIYLTHMFIVIPMAQVIKTNELGEQWLIPLLFLSLALSFLLGWLISTRFSEPVNRWLRNRIKTD
ncbi:MAG: acyltransferase family protein [Ekhidna sp.]